MALETICYNELKAQEILAKFELMDADGSGAIDFEEFVAVMTSDLTGQDFFNLKDEQDQGIQHQAFYEFATTYRREMLLEIIEGRGNFFEEKLEGDETNSLGSHADTKEGPQSPTSKGPVGVSDDVRAFQQFKELFELQLVNDKRHEASEGVRKDKLERLEHSRWLAEVRRNNKSARTLRKRQDTEKRLLDAKQASTEQKKEKQKTDAKRKILQTTKRLLAHGELTMEDSALSPTPDIDAAASDFLVTSSLPAFSTNLMATNLSVDGNLDAGDYSFFSPTPEERSSPIMDETDADDLVSDALFQLGIPESPRGHGRPSMQGGGGQRLSMQGGGGQRLSMQGGQRLSMQRKDRSPTLEGRTTGLVESGRQRLSFQERGRSPTLEGRTLQVDGMESGRMSKSPATETTPSGILRKTSFSPVPPSREVRGTVQGGIDLRAKFARSPRATAVNRSTALQESSSSSSSASSSEDEGDEEVQQRSNFLQRMTYMNSSAMDKKKIDMEFAFGRRKSQEEAPIIPEPEEEETQEEVDVGSTKVTKKVKYQQKLTQGQLTHLKLCAYEDAREARQARENSPLLKGLQALASSSPEVSPRPPGDPQASNYEDHTNSSRRNRFSRRFVKSKNDRPTYAEMKRKEQRLSAVRQWETQPKSKPSPSYMKRKSITASATTTNSAAASGTSSPVMMIAAATQVGRDTDGRRQSRPTMFQMPLDNRGRTTALYRSLQRPPLLSPPPPQAKTIGGIRVGSS
ncbi:hypothetical protein TeGR_g10323, partial [Tetraparma gracilis]